MPKRKESAPLRVAPKRKCTSTVVTESNAAVVDLKRVLIEEEIQLSRLRQDEVKQRMEHEAEQNAAQMKIFEKILSGDKVDTVPSFL